MKILRTLLLSFFLIASFPLLADNSVNINTADKDTLVTMLNGVGEKKAEAIIAYREENGPFESAADLTNVTGIGESTIEKNQDIIVVTDQ